MAMVRSPFRSPNYRLVNPLPEIGSGFFIFLEKFSADMLPRPQRRYLTGFNLIKMDLI